MAAWHGEPVEQRSRAFYVFMVVYIAAVLVIVGICLWNLWGEVLAAWPK